MYTDGSQMCNSNQEFSSSTRDSYSPIHIGYLYLESNKYIKHIQSKTEVPVYTLSTPKLLVLCLF